jgi:hypothetical protein
MIDTRFPGDTRPFAERWTHELLVDLATEWQEVLKLADWTVDVTILPQVEIGDNFGLLMKLVPQKQYALVELLDPEDYEPDPDLIEPYDPEVTIVHELLHIYTSRIFRDPLHRPAAQDTVAEQLAHHLSHALVSQKRAILERKQAFNDGFLKGLAARTGHLEAEAA